MRFTPDRRGWGLLPIEINEINCDISVLKKREIANLTIWGKKKKIKNAGWI